ncbi:hypothetical protein FRE64_07290 [Euhalothece natronophila Z-M001]|uniref:Uncharacterized protein n=1 Tax=Euhalothece natronophila Z-M001 TaxID=522448 RepID=A0A5B8NNK0_9CHRO|nr:hypothetical protein [Euhalothece natronophila]QDZ39760.1 hypothetical protein FRE64_07290 [Euhalothece natronophila Z-M001]
MPFDLSSLPQKKEVIYNHLESCIKQESPEQVMTRYYTLFVQATGYENVEIRENLEKIMKSEEGKKTLFSFLSYVFYLPINYWLKQSSEVQQIIPNFVKMLENIPPFARVQTPVARRIREAVTQFNKSDSFLGLKRLQNLLTSNPTLQQDKSQPLSTLLGRYPFLYQHCLLVAESSAETKRVLKQFQQKQQGDFELSLSRYITNQVRLARLTKRYGSPTEAQKHLTLVPNPSLLKDQEVIATLQHFISGIEGQSTYQDLAQRFIIHSAKAETFKTYKKDLYEYLIKTVDEGYGKRQLNQKLSSHLKNSLSKWDRETPNEQLILRVTNNLLKFLVVESDKNIDHYLYLDLVTNLGPTKTIGLLLKILLISPKIYPYLTSRFAILYQHYENTPRYSVHWLFKSLETLQIALTIHCSGMDVSYWRSAKALGSD